MFWLPGNLTCDNPSQQFLIFSNTYIRIFFRAWFNFSNFMKILSLNMWKRTLKIENSRHTVKSRLTYCIYVAYNFKTNRWLHPRPSYPVTPRWKLGFLFTQNEKRITSAVCKPSRVCMCSMSKYVYRYVELSGWVGGSKNYWDYFHIKKKGWGHKSSLGLFSYKEKTRRCQTHTRFFIFRSSLLVCRLYAYEIHKIAFPWS